MTLERPILLVGGAPRVPVDAIRHLTVAATGTTALALQSKLRRLGRESHLLLSLDAVPAPGAKRYADRDALEETMGSWIAQHPDGCVVMSAAVNDYRVTRVERWEGGEVRALRPGEKLPSGADEVVIRLRQDSKLIDRLRPSFGLRGPIIGFKYEDAATVLASAAALCGRVKAACIAANSLCGSVLAVVDAGGVERHTSRESLIEALTSRIAAA
jgi:hypothetical protein